MSEAGRLFICTGDGRLLRVALTSGVWSSDTLLGGVGAQCVASHGGRVLVGLRDRGALLSNDGGASWQDVELAEPRVFSVAISGADGALYAGTEPSRLFASRDGGAWTELRALQDIPSRDRWSFPPRPWTHHVRWIAPDPMDANRLLVGIELGGVMYSDDRGATFSDHRPGAKRDVHSMVWHPRAEGRVYEAAGDGAAWSHDGGLNWDGTNAGRELPYCWAVAVDADDPECWYVSAASGPRTAHSERRSRGRLYRWADGRWHELPLPDESMPYALAVSAEGLVAGMATGRLFHSTDRGASWHDAEVDTGSILSMVGV
ncbi:MAG: hypothetical protein JOZ64_05400 [Solirubrobacterales bacterium]|nr:hypothetical protein [Solirubrobacterales bacterium]